MNAVQKRVPVSIEMAVLEHQQRNVKVFFSPRLFISVK